MKSYIALLAITASGLTTNAANAAPAQVARTADQILSDFVTASGGVAPWKKHRSLSASMTLSVVGMGVDGTGTTLWTSKNQYLETAEVPNMMTLRRGGDGKRFWSQDPIDGLRWLQSAEAEQTKITAAWMGNMRLKELATSIGAVASIDNLDCIETAYKASPPVIYCFDRTSHLLTLEQGKKASPQGDTPYVTRSSDYRDVGGVKFPFLQETTAGPATFSIALQTVKWDVPTSPAQFKLPKAAKK